MDYSLKTPEERLAFINTLSDEEVEANASTLADYILNSLPKDPKILTDNRMITINKREISYQGVADTLEAGEDGIYSILSDMGKSVLLSPKIEITQEDVSEIPEMEELRSHIKETEAAAAKATGRRKYLLKKQLIEMRQQQYILKEMWRAPASGRLNKVVSHHGLDLSENITIDKDGEPHSDCLINIFDPEHVSALLRNWESLETAYKTKVNDDMYYFLIFFKETWDGALADKPILKRITELKIRGDSNQEIKEKLASEFDTHHTPEYISSLWRKKIPKIISEYAKEQWLIYHYTYEEYGHWKKCSRCGQVKLAHNRFFSKNKTSKDHFYSICKECRNKKRKGG